MPLDKNKLVAEATKHVQKGQWDKAIKVYEKILAEDPRDVRVLLKVGELQQKKGDAGAAAETLHRVAQAYTDQGFFLKAVAVYKQIVKLAPGEVRVHEKLASLYQQLGIVSDAMSQLQLVAQGAEAAGDERKLFEVLGRMVELDPENPGAAVKLGELHAKGGAAAAALEQFRRAAEVLKRGNRLDDYAKVAERIAALAPADHALTRELANLYLGRGDTKRALAKLQLCFKADPQDVETLALLAAAFRELGQLSKTVSVYKELARIEGERGRPAQARAAWQRIAEIAPDDPDAQEALGASAGALRAAPAAAAPIPAAPSTAAPIPAQASAPALAAAPRQSAPVARPPAEALPKLLQETEVFAKYGLYKKALDHLEKVFAADPDHLEARERARELCRSSGDAAGAAEHGARAVSAAIAHRELPRAAAALQRLAELAPGDPRLPALAAALRDAERGGGEAEVVVEPGDADADGEELVLELEAEPEDAAAPGDALALDEVSFEAAPLDDVSFSDDVTFSTGPEEEVSISAADEPLPPVADEAPGEVAAAPAAAFTEAADERLVEEEPSAEIEVEPELATAGGLAAAAEAGATPEPDLQAELDELDFFVQQGLLDDAREVLAGLLALYPDHAQLRARAAGLAPRAAPAGGVEDGSFDLGRELADELDAAPAAGGPDLGYDVRDVFQEFEKGLAATAVPEEDGETHYDLGIAYKEMGMLEEAIHELEVALGGRAPRKAVDCHTMIGLCRLEQGDAGRAVEAFRRALEDDRLAPEAARALHFELARAHEVLGDAQGALWYLQKVIRADPRFRDARDRAERLGGGPGRPPPGDPDAAPEAPRRAAAKKIGYV